MKRWEHLDQDEQAQKVRREQQLAAKQYYDAYRRRMQERILSLAHRVRCIQPGKLDRLSDGDMLRIGLALSVLNGELERVNMGYEGNVSLSEGGAPPF